MSSNSNKAILSIYASKCGIFIVPKVLVPGPTFLKSTPNIVLHSPIDIDTFRRAIVFALSESEIAFESQENTWSGAESLEVAAHSLGSGAVEEFVTSAFGVEVELTASEIMADVIVEGGTPLFELMQKDKSRLSWRGNIDECYENILKLVKDFL
jgi:hypothetical protein